MSDQFFQSIHRRLIKAGVAPKHVRRVVAEFRDHYADLLENAKSPGLPMKDAQREALARLGSEDVLVETVLAKQHPRAWSVTMPWLVYGLVPTLALIATVVFAVVAVGFGVQITEAQIDQRIIAPRWLVSVVQVAYWSITNVVPILLAAWVGYHALTHQRPWLWPILGLIAVCLVGGAVDMGATIPMDVNEERSITVGFAFAPPFPDLFQSILHGLGNVLAAGTVSGAIWLRRYKTV